MTNKVLHLSIALLTLASSLHASDGQKRPKKPRTFAQVAQATQQPGLAGILPLSEAVEAAKTKQVENTNCLSGQPASILTATQEMLARAAAVFVAKQEEPIEMQPTAQPTQDLPFPEAAQTKAGKVAPTFEKLAQAADESSAVAAAALAALTKPEDAPTRSGGLEPEAQVVQDPNNPFVRWAGLQAELESINKQLQELQDPNAASIESTQAQAHFEQRKEEVTREILALEKTPTPYEPYTGARRSTEPDQAEINEALARKQSLRHKLPPAALKSILYRTNCPNTPDSLNLLVTYQPRETKGGRRFELVPKHTFVPFQDRVTVPTSRKNDIATNQAFAAERNRTRSLKELLEGRAPRSLWGAITGLVSNQPGSIAHAEQEINIKATAVNERPRTATLRECAQSGAALVKARKSYIATQVYGPQYLADRAELVRIDNDRKK